MSNNQTQTALPKLRFPEFREAEGWDVKPLDDVCENILNGGTPSTSKNNYWNGEVEWLTPAEMGKSAVRFVESTSRKITNEGLKNCSSGLAPEGSVIVSTRAPIGLLAMNLRPMAFNQGCKALIPHQNTDADFLFYSMVRSTNDLRDLGSGNTFKELSSTALKKFELFCPPDKKEQQRIADCLSSVDELIAAEGQKLEALQDHKKGLMHELFPAEGETLPKLRFPEFREAEAWEVKPLDDVCDVLNNRRKPISSNKREAGEYPYYGASGIVDYVKDYIFDERLVLIGEDGAKWGAYDKTAFIVEGKYWVNNHAHVLKPTFINDFLLENYLVKLDISPFITGAAQHKLTLGKLKTIPVPVPTEPEEQQKIADCLSSVDELIAVQEKKLKALQEHKCGLMQQLFPVLSEVMG